MSGNRSGGRTETCESVRQTLSDYLEGSLSGFEEERISEHLVICDGCRREEASLSALLDCLHGRVPQREPSLDIWAELGPKVAAAMEEEKMAVPARLRLRATRFLGNVAAGAILFTQALAMNTETRMHRYLIQDPFRMAEED
jgi:anti-sigma factor ChrR (cupin superfamily)